MVRVNMAKVDRAKGAVDRSRDAPIELKLTGSQINLQERPRSNNAFSRYPSRTSIHNIKRPVSATPHLGYYQQNTMRRLVNWSRPQSAEASTFGPRRNKLAANFRQSSACHDEHDLGLVYSGFNNHSSDSDSDLVSAYNRRKSFADDETHCPNDSTKMDVITYHQNPPSKTSLAPPRSELNPVDELSKNRCSTSRPKSSKPIIDMNMSDEENLDDIVALKFQRWFPSSKADKASMIMERQETKSNSSGMYYHASKFEVRNYLNSESLMDFINDIDDEELLRDEQDDWSKNLHLSQQTPSSKSSPQTDAAKTPEKSTKKQSASQNCFERQQSTISQNDRNNNASHSKSTDSFKFPANSKLPDSKYLAGTPETTNKASQERTNYFSHQSSPKVDFSDSTEFHSQADNLRPDKSVKYSYLPSKSFLCDTKNSTSLHVNTDLRFENSSEIEKNSCKYEKEICQTSNVSSCDTDKILSSSGYSTGKTPSDNCSSSSGPGGNRSNLVKTNISEIESNNHKILSPDLYQSEGSKRLLTTVKSESMNKKSDQTSTEAKPKSSDVRSCDGKSISTPFPFQYSTKVHTLSTVVINGERSIRPASNYDFSKDGGMSTSSSDHQMRFETVNYPKSNDADPFPPSVTTNERVEEVTKVVIDGRYCNEIFYSFDRQSSPTTQESCELPTDLSKSENTRQNLDPKMSAEFNSWTKTNIREFKETSSGQSVESKDASIDRSNHRTKLSERDLNPNLTYDELLDVIKAIEEDEKESHTTLNAGDSLKSGINQKRSSSSSDIWSFLDELDGNTFENGANKHSTPKREAGISNSNSNSNLRPIPTRLNELICLSNAELAQHVMSLALQIEDMEIALESSSKRLKEMQESLRRQKDESEEAIKRHQKFIDQLLKEKLTLTSQCTKIIGEMEKQYDATLKNIEGKYMVEMKKQEEKHLAAEKIRKDKWIDTKTQKIKEMTVKSLEPELNRMANQHQEELTEMRKIYQKQLEQQEEMSCRRLNALKEKMESEKENALVLEKESSRNRLENEVAELEKRYQEQRRKLLGDLHVERENLEKETEALLAEKGKELERRYAQKEKELEQIWAQKETILDEKLAAREAQYKSEMKSLENSLEMEKERWKEKETIKLNEKEKLMREQCKRERDRHIESVIDKLEREASQKEQAIENKLKRLREQFEKEIEEHEQSADSLRKKLNETRISARDKDEQLIELKAQVSRTQSENSMLKEICDRLTKEQAEIRTSASNELSTQIAALQKELAQMRLNHEAEIIALRSEKEWELSQVYSRVKEAVGKKEEVIHHLQREKSSALSKCRNLEKLLEEKRRGAHS